MYVRRCTQIDRITFSHFIFQLRLLFEYFQDLEEREWLTLHFEQLHSADYKRELSDDNRKQIAELLIKSQAWDNFMATKFPTVKRYGGEGAESLLAFFWQLLRNSVQGNSYKYRFFRFFIFCASVYFIPFFMKILGWNEILRFDVLNECIPYICIPSPRVEYQSTRNFVF